LGVDLRSRRAPGPPLGTPDPSITIAPKRFHPVSFDAMPPIAEPAPDCPQPAGAFAPVVDARRCEGKAACEAVCPYGVFEIRRFARSELAPLGVMGTLRWWVNGGRQADVVGADRCHACGLCVKACPEDAITLRRVGGGAV
jgi:NAD-dependent dihydropyrimidine dehydrogenase PreA subunit